MLQVRSSPDASFQLEKILGELKIEYKLVEKSRLAPVVDLVIYEFLLNLSSAAFVEVVSRLVKKLWNAHVHVEYETRYEMALRYLKDREPVIPISRQDRDDFSEYVFKTKDSRYKWTYDRGAITCGPEK